MTPIKYSTVQNWYPGRQRTARGGIYNFVTKRGDCCRGTGRKISWTQVETGSAITWKYPSVILRATIRWASSLGGAHQQPPAGRHRHQDDPHGPQHPQHHRLKGISAGRGSNTFRGLVKICAQGRGARNHPCDSLLIGDPLRGPHLPDHRGPQPTGARRARGDTTSRIGEGPALLRDAARHLKRRGRGVDDRQWLLPRGVQGAADGIRGGGAKVAWA